MFTAYDTLSNGMKARIANLRGVHCINKLRNHRVEVTRPGGAAYYKTQSSIPDECHPIVRTHPVSGRKGLYISPRFTISIVNMDDAEAHMSICITGRSMIW